MPMGSATPSRVCLSPGCTRSIVIANCSVKADMGHHELTTPVSEAQVRALRIDDTVTLQGTLYGIRDATQIAMFDRGRKTRFDLSGHAVIHTAPNVKKVAPSGEHPTDYAPVCVGTTTSARMERFTRPLLTQCGVRLIIGKGGLGAG